MADKKEDTAVAAITDTNADEANAKDHVKADVAAQTVGQGPVILANPDKPLVKQGASFTVEVPFDPQLVEHHQVVQLVERALRQYFAVINFEVGNVEDWVYKHLTDDEKVDQGKEDVVEGENANTAGGVAVAQGDGEATVKEVPLPDDSKK